MKKIFNNDSVRRYAIGDIHGCLDEMKVALQWCFDDAKTDNVAAEVILLGDLVDKGPESKEVVNFLLDFENTDTFKLTTLKGNHDLMLANVWHDPNYYLVNTWWQHGGQQTLMSYGWHPLMDRRPNRLEDYIPKSHIDFLSDLPVMYETDDLIFVHAGLRPGVAVADQTEHDLLWIRGQFLAAKFDFGKPVIHGHAPDKKNPMASNYRVGLDTGCFGSGKLAVAAFDPGERVPRTAVVTRNSVDEIPKNESWLTI